MDGSTLDPTYPPYHQQAAVGGSGESSKALLTHPVDENALLMSEENKQAG